MKIYISIDPLVLYSSISTILSFVGLTLLFDFLKNILSICFTFKYLIASQLNDNFNEYIITNFKLYLFHYNSIIHHLRFTLLEKKN